MDFKEFIEKIKSGNSSYFKWHSTDICDSNKAILADIVFVNGDKLKSIYSEDHMPTRSSTFENFEQMDKFDNVIRFLDTPLFREDTILNFWEEEY